MRLALIFGVLSTCLPGTPLGLAIETRHAIAACGTDPNEFTPLLKEVAEAKDGLSTAEARLQSVLNEAAKSEDKLETLETKREQKAQEVSVESRGLANELGELEALRRQTTELRQRLRNERYYLERTIAKLDHEKAFVKTRREHLSQESMRIKSMELENARLHNSIDSWDVYRVEDDDKRLREMQQGHEKELRQVEQHARALERNVGAFQANVQHWRQDQRDAQTSEVRLHSIERQVLKRQAHLEKLEEELRSLEAQVNRNIQLNNKMGKLVKQARADRAKASKEAIDHQSSTLNIVHAKFQDRDRLATERKAAIDTLANDLQGTEGVLKGVRSELGAKDTSIKALRGAIKDTQNALKTCQDKRMPEHFADDMKEFSSSLPNDAEPSQSDRFLAKMGELAQSVADPSEPPEPEGDAQPSADGLDKISKLADLLP